MTLEKAKELKDISNRFIIAREDYDKIIIYNNIGFFVYPFEKYISNPKRLNSLHKKTDWTVYVCDEPNGKVRQRYLNFKELPILAEVN